MAGWPRSKQKRQRGMSVQIRTGSRRRAYCLALLNFFDPVANPNRAILRHFGVDPTQMQ
jgi:hypothetical protein